SCILLSKHLVNIAQLKVVTHSLREIVHRCNNTVRRVKKFRALVLIVSHNQPRANKLESKKSKESTILINKEEQPVHGLCHQHCPKLLNILQGLTCTPDNSAKRIVSDMQRQFSLQR